MWGSVTVYVGLVAAVVGLGLAAKPLPWLGATASRGIVVAAAGLLLAGAGVLLPARESRVGQVATRLDTFSPAWQFREIHSIRIAAPPQRVFEAVTQVRADEIFLFRTLTWIRRGGRQLPPGILNPGDREPIIDVATANGFVRLAQEPPRELVVGTAVIAPPGTPLPVTARLFQDGVPPGFALATMNFLVRPDGAGSLLTTETRVFASDSTSRRRFAGYWRLIYPGSALIRRMWLRAIERRAERSH